MWYKKGSAETKGPMTIVMVIIGIIILLAILSIFVVFMVAVFGSGNDCDNISEWEKIATELSKADNLESYSENLFFFNGEKCGLTGFSAAYTNPQEALYRGEEVPIGTTFCLCNFKNNICNAKECYTFKNIKSIEQLGGKQFTTKGIPGYISIDIKRSGDKLIINTPNPTNTYTATYEHTEEFEPLDEGLTKEFKIEYTLNSPKYDLGSLYPFIVKSDTYPQPNFISTKQPPLKFKLSAGFTEGKTPNALLASQKYILKEEHINSAQITFIIPQSYAEAYQTNNLRLFALIGENEWSTYQMNCNEDTGELLCSVGLDRFAEYWVISI